MMWLGALNDQNLFLKGVDFMSLKILTSSQTTEKALGDAMCEMERVSETSTMLAKTLDEQRTKLKIAEEELVMY
jgi:hypothetical protein